MVTMNGYTVTPHHRQNRRRERPGSRSRRTITRKSNIQNEYTEGLLDAYDSSVRLPSDKARPSLFRENFHQNWQRWKAKEAEEKALEMEKLQLEQEEQQRLYGGDVSDDELIRMGILYDNKDEDNSVECEVPFEQASPMFILRHSKPKHSRRRSTWRSLPLYLSFSSLGEDADIARLLSPSISNMPTPMTIQHREPIPTDIPQSLPPTPALESATVHGSPHLLPNTPIEISQPHSLPLSTTGDDWEFINTPHSHQDPHISTPVSEPETWIFLSDDS